MMEEITLVLWSALCGALISFGSYSIAIDSECREFGKTSSGKWLMTCEEKK